MAIASGVRADLIYIEEVTRGTTPGTPTMKVLRTTGRNINLQKNMLQTKEVRSDRQVADVRHGFNQVGGSIPFELSLESYNDFLEGALAGRWGTISTSGVNLSAVAATDKFVRATGSWVTDGYYPGDYIVSAGFTDPANNGVFLVTAVTATDLSISGSLVDEASTSGRTIDLKGKRVKCGTTLLTYTIERRFADISQYQTFKGVAVQGMDLNVKPEDMVGGTFNLIGMSSPALAGSTGASAVTAAPTNSPFSAFDGAVYENGTAIAVVTSLELKLENGRTVEPVVGSKFSPDVFEGTANITGTAMMFFENATMFNKFVNETSSGIWIKLNELGTSDFMSIVIPKIKYTGGEIDPPQEGPIAISMPFRALYDSVSGTSLRFQRSTSS